MLSRAMWLPLGVEQRTAKPQYPHFWAILPSLCSLEQKINKKYQWIFIQVSACSDPSRAPSFLRA